MFTASSVNQSVSDKMKEMLVDHGLFSQQAEEVMVKVITEHDGPMSGCWGTSLIRHEREVIMACWMEVTIKAVQWAEQNKPQAWWIHLLRSVA